MLTLGGSVLRRKALGDVIDFHGAVIPFAPRRAFDDVNGLRCGVRSILDVGSFRQEDVVATERLTVGLLAELEIARDIRIGRRRDGRTEGKVVLLPDVADQV